MRNKSTVYRLAIDSIMASVYFALTFLKVDAGVFRISLGAILPIFVCLSFPFIDSFSICFLGIFLEQLFFGLTPTTVLWMLPPLLRPLIISPFTHHYYKKNENMEDHKVLSIVLVIIASLCVSLANTGVLYLDSFIMDYPYAAALQRLAFQTLITISIGIVFTIILFPVIKILRKNNLFNKLQKEKVIHTQTIDDTLAENQDFNEILTQDLKEDSEREINKKGS